MDRHQLDCTWLKRQTKTERRRTRTRQKTLNKLNQTSRGSGLTRANMEIWTPYKVVKRAKARVMGFVGIVENGGILGVNVFSSWVHRKIISTH